MFRLLVLALFALATTPSVAQERHFLGPTEQHRFSLCIVQPDCMDVGGVALLTGGVTVYEGYLVVELTCRVRNDIDYEPRDVRLTRAAGNSYIPVTAQFHTHFFRWCNLSVSNYDNDGQGEYSAFIAAEPERDPPKSLWLGRKMTRPTPPTP